MLWQNAGTMKDWQSHHRCINGKPFAKHHVTLSSACLHDFHSTHVTLSSVTPQNVKRMRGSLNMNMSHDSGVPSKPTSLPTTNTDNQMIVLLSISGNCDASELPWEFTVCSCDGSARCVLGTTSLRTLEPGCMDAFETQNNRRDCRSSAAAAALLENFICGYQAPPSAPTTSPGQRLSSFLDGMKSQ